MVIRSAAIADIDRIIELQNQIYRVKEKSLGAEEALANQLLDETCEVLVAEENGMIIATATIYFIEVAIRNKPYALLEGLVVDEKHRGHGVGSDFFKKCIE